MTASPRLALPFIIPGQAQKELIHNEALLRLDLATHASAVAIGLNTPPAAPENGQAWIIGPSPTDEWTGKAHYFAGWTENGWRFVQPFVGLSVWLIGDNTFARWDGADWVAGTLSGSMVEIGGEQVLGSRQPAIASPASGEVVDVEARSAVVEILDAMRAHGLIEV